MGWRSVWSKPPEHRPVEVEPTLTEKQQAIVDALARGDRWMTAAEIAESIAADYGESGAQSWQSSRSVACTISYMQHGDHCDMIKKISAGPRTFAYKLRD